MESGRGGRGQREGGGERKKEKEEGTHKSGVVGAMTLKGRGRGKRREEGRVMTDGKAGRGSDEEWGGWKRGKKEKEGDEGREKAEEKEKRRKRRGRIKEVWWER